MRKLKFMKRLQALVVASLLVATSVPTVTYASSTNRVTKTVSVAKNTELKGESAPVLAIELKDDLEVGSEFYLELKNAEWIADDVVVEATNVDGEAVFKTSLVDKNTLAVKLTDYKVSQSSADNSDQNQSNQNQGSQDKDEDNKDEDNKDEDNKGEDNKGEDNKGEDNKGEDNKGEEESNDITGGGPGSNDVLPADAVIRVRLSSTLKKSSAYVMIDADGTGITSNKSGIEYASVSTSGATAKISEVKNMTEGGTLGDITIEESFAGAFYSELNRDGDLVMTLKLDNPDVEFGSVKNAEVVGTKGFSGVTGTISAVEDDEIKITVRGSSLADKEKGAFKIEGLSLETVDDEPVSGGVNIDIESDSFKNISLQVAKFVKDCISVNITPYSTDNKKGLVAGRSGLYKIEITESSEELISDGKRLTFDLENGYFLDAGTTESKKALAYFEEEITLPSEMSLSSVTLNDTKIVSFTVDVEADEEDIDEYSLKVPVAVDLDSISDQVFDITEVSDTTTDDSNTDADSKDEGSTATFGGGEDSKKDDEKEDKDTDDEKDEEETEKSTKKKSSSKSDKIPDVKLTISGKALSGDDVTETVTSVIKPVTISLEEKVYKLGAKDQDGTDIVIKETGAGMVNKGTIAIAFDDADGLSFTEAPTVKVTKGDLKLGEGKLIRDGNRITGFKINVPKTSRTASTITISDIKVTSDRSVPEGKIGILVGGSAFTEGEPIASDSYVVIKDVNESDNTSTANSEMQKQLDDLKTSINTQLQQQQKEAPLTAIFTIDSNAYSVNGASKQMDGTPYISADGRTMIPVRYVADALGITPDKILSNSGIITILGKDATVQFKLNSNIMLKNGAQIPMDTKAVLKEGRTYIPVSFAATALGVSAKYDATTKTVTFQNESAQKGQVATTPAVATQQQSTQPTATTQQQSTQQTSQTTTQTTEGEVDAVDLFDILNSMDN